MAGTDILNKDCNKRMVKWAINIESFWFYGGRKLKRWL